MNGIRRSSSAAAILALALGLAGETQAITAGVFQFVAGNVRVTLAEGGERTAIKGSPVGVGDTIATAPDGTAQIKMGDGAIVVVQPRSRVTVAAFHYAGREDGSENVRFRLDEGGFRTVTGAIGRTHKNNYLIETPIAHIGVRGTDHESYYFPASRGQSDGAGVYNKVNTGLTYIRTRSGEVVIGPNQVGYAASAQDAPHLLPAIPNFFNRAVEPREARRGPVNGEAPPQVATAAAGQGNGLTPQVVQVVTTSAGGINLSNLDTSVSAAPVSGSVVGYTAQQGGGISRGLSGFNLSIAPNGATLANTGGDAAWGVNWGSWQGGLATVAGNATNGSTHFIDSANLTSAAQLAALPPGLVTATYSYAGGPAPTDSSGTAGTVSSLNVGVNFSTQKITSYAVNAGIAGNTWSASGSGTFSQFSGASGIPLTGSCTGCTGNGTATGKANGAFVGSAAERMITSFGLKTGGGPGGNQAISGVGYLSR